MLVSANMGLARSRQWAVDDRMMDARTLALTAIEAVIEVVIEVVIEGSTVLCVCVCVSCPPFCKAPRATLRGGWDT